MLHFEEERLRLAIQAARIGTWDFDLVSGELSWDARCKALFGLPPEASVTYDGVFLAGLHPDDRAPTDEAVQKALRAGAPSQFDIQYRTRGLTDGVERWVAATGETLFEGDRAVRFVGTVRDITEQKRAERRFELLNRTVAQIATELDLDRIVQAITDAGVELAGAEFGAFFYNVEDEQGEWYTLYALSGAPREHFERFGMPRKTAVFGPTFDGAGVVRSPDILADPRYGLSAPHHGMPEGHLPVRSYLAVPVVSVRGACLGGLFFGHSQTGCFGREHEQVLVGLAGHAAAAIDNARLFEAAEKEIAERRRVESALNAYAERLTFLDGLGRATAEAADASQVLAVTTQMLGEHLDVDICAYADMEADQDAFTIRGDWSRAGVASIVGTYRLATFGELAVERLRAGQPLILNDNIGEIGADQSAMFLQIGIRATICMPFLRKGVLTALMAVHCVSPRVWTPEVLALVAEVTDRCWAHIERVRAMMALKTFNATLEQRVAHAVADRAAAEERLHQAQKMEAVGQLTGGIAHDFNNMLSVVVAGLQLTRRRLAQGDQNVDRFIEGALEGAGRAASLTQRLLAFSRRQALTPAALQINTLIGGMTELLSRTLGETIRVRTSLAPDLWLVFADAVQLESAILNLSVNSRDAMPSGGSLAIETSNAGIEDEAGAPDGLLPGDYVVLSVRDTGEGMSHDVMARAFEPFFTTKGVGKGSGLGLSQVFGFVRQSGGHIGIESEPGQGTTVRIYLPRHDGVAVAAETSSRRAHAIHPSKGEIVLVVEDEERVRNFSAEALRDLGYVVRVASDVRDAINYLESPEPVSLLFTDIVMPEMTGWQLAEEARQRRPGIKVLFTTGYAGTSAAKLSVSDPSTIILQKPFGIEELAAKVRAALGD